MLAHMRNSPRLAFVQLNRLNPKAYFVLGTCLFLLKFVIDRAIAGLAFDRSWSLADYLIPTQVFGGISPDDQLFIGIMLLVAVPFVIVGVIATVRRLHDAQMPLWLTLLFFLPVANLVFFAVLSVIPSAVHRSAIEPLGPAAQDDRPPAVDAPHQLGYGVDGVPESVARRSMEWLLPVDARRSAVAATLLPVPLALCSIILSVVVFSEYGAAVFMAMPFAIGLLSAVLHGYGAPRTWGQCVRVGAMSMAACGAATIMFAIEGLGCLIMLAPLAVPAAMIGAALGYSIQSRPARPQGIRNTLWTVSIILPLIIAVDGSLSGGEPTVHSVTTFIEVNAPPSRVWTHVIAFRDIPSPTDEWIFRAGVAYPVRATIDGTGVGAVRYCEFSTGAFVEPIEVWDEPRLLRFSVVSNPPPMREWSPFHIHPPHLDGFLVSRGGQFRLVELPSGRTRLEGTTWYSHGLVPERYWRWWCDYIIERIHHRVLTHISSETTANADATQPSPQ